MKRNAEDEGRYVIHSRGLGTVTEEMVRQRARELALLGGRSPKHLQDSDLEQARRELSGEEVLMPCETRAERLPEGERWMTVQESVGRKGLTVLPHDEQTDAERLVEEGLSEAEHDRMVEGTKESLRRDLGRQRLA